MHDNTLMKISLTIALLGLLALYFVASSLEYGDDVYSAEEGSRVSIKGKVTSITEYDSSKVIELSPYARTRIVVFDDFNAEIDDSIEVIGTAKDYKGRRELVAERIRKI